MKLAEFDENVARKVMDLWQEHLGFWHSFNLYCEHPAVLAACMTDREYWASGRFEDRIGSRYTDDSKLLAYLRHGELEIACYVQAPVALGAERR